MTLSLVIIFLDGGTYSRTLMTKANILSLSVDGTYYNVMYEGVVYQIQVSDVVFIVDYNYTINKNLTPVEGWAEYVPDYSTYLISR